MALPRPATALLLVLLVGLVRAQFHLIRVVVLAAVGLGGMYMLHVLAQDYNKIRQPVRPSGPAAAVAKLLFKRAAPAGAVEILRELPDWERILSEDPRGCARSVVCQLAANSVRDEENGVLAVLREPGGAGGARQLFLEAAELGRRARDPAACQARYPSCPYSAPRVLQLLHGL